MLRQLPDSPRSCQSCLNLAHNRTTEDNQHAGSAGVRETPRRN